MKKHENMIGIIGFAGAGKDTVADILVADYNFDKESFAAPLKQTVAAMFGWNPELMEGDTEESREFRESVDLFWSNKLGIEHFTPRKAMQMLGTDIVRTHFNDEMWIHSLEYRIRKLHNPGKYLVISDARFPNELKLIHSLKGKLVRVKRDNNDPEWYHIALAANRGDKSAIHEMRVTYADVHPSEWSCVGCEVDYEINNTGTLDDLRTQVAAMMVDFDAFKNQK